MIFVNLINFRGGINSECQIGYTGPLCQSCDIIGDTIYFKSRLYYCEECKESYKSILELIGYSVILLIFYYMIIRLILIYFIFNFIFRINITFLFEYANNISRGNSENNITNKKSVGIFLKILLNYFQIVSFCKDLNLNWPYLTRILFEIQMKIGETTNQILSFECFFKCLKNSFLKILKNFYSCF